MTEQLTALRRAMAEHNIDFYLIPTDDFHGSEYVGDYFKARAYVSGFTGSAGTLVVSKDFAGLWTDGRYFLQAAQQLDGTGIDLMKMGAADVPTVDEFIFSSICSGQTLGFDGRCISMREFTKLDEGIRHAGANIKADIDLAGEIWSDRPPISEEAVFDLGPRDAGKPRTEKLAELRREVKKLGADIFMLTSLDDIAWLLNIRGDDVECTPVALSYFVLTEGEAVLFISPSAVPRSICDALRQDGISLRGYGEIYDYAASISSGKSVLYDGRKANSALILRLKDGVKLIDKPNPTLMAKAVKNPIECENERRAHIFDGIALTKFMHWLKTNVGKIPMDELSLAEKLENFRFEHGSYLGPSFAPIVSYADHGAIVHYSATEDSSADVTADSFLLVDTGGHYYEGTTDVTRTFALGGITDEMKRNYTAVLRGNLNLAAAKFLHGATGANLDILARRPLWEIGLDYNHGTGHGVGYLLSVHEGPNAFRYRVTALEDNVALVPGMITSDEPGLYITGKYGIRLENMILCAKDRVTEFGEFLKFETLTMVPFDLDAVDPSLMSADEKKLLNDYHAEVFRKLSAYMNDEERQWLLSATRAV